MLKRLMNRRELVSHLARTAGVSEVSVATVLTELARVAGEESKSNGAFLLPGIGLIEMRESPERIAQNPSTGELIKLRAKINVAFEFASQFKQAAHLPRPDNEN